MNDLEHKGFLQKIKETAKKVSEKPEYARQLLEKAGIINKKGELTKYYRS